MPNTRVALLGDSYPLRDGFRVRLRMARSSDAIPLRELLDAAGRTAGDLDLARLVQFDPRRRYVLCATALIDGAETLVGVGSIEIGDDGPPEPDILVVAQEHPEDVAELIAAALIGRASAAQAHAA